jgi:ABC-type multidrug transport system ATPase subunit
MLCWHPGVLQGTIALDGVNLQYGTPGQRQYLRKCGFVDQFPYLPETLTVEESLTLQYYFLHARHPVEAQAVPQMASVVTSTLEQVLEGSTSFSLKQVAAILVGRTTGC